MNTFKSAKWDLDAQNDSFQELFQNSKKSKIIKKKIKSHIKNLENRVKKNISNLSATKLRESDTLNLISTPTNNGKINKSKKRRIKNSQAKERSNASKALDTNSGDATINMKKKSKIKELTRSNTIPLINGQLSKRKQKKLNVKYEDEIHDRTDVSLESNNIEKNKKSRKKRKLQEASTLSKDNSVAKHLLSEDQSLAQKLLDDKQSGPMRTSKKEKLYNKLRETLNSAKEKKPVLTLRQRMMEKLKAARFRYINEQIYTANSTEAQKIFRNDPDAYKAYHDGYRKQVKSWPMNPLDIIISAVKKMPKTHVIADFGCGDARLSKSVVQKVHSFDLVAADETVTACDMSRVPLGNNSVDVTVFCLSLMGTNLKDYLMEANRVLKIGGVLKIAEVESRFENVEDFIKAVQLFGFKNIWKDLSHNHFYFLDFKKETDIKNKKKLPALSLLPCLYKKR